MTKLYDFNEKVLIVTGASSQTAEYFFDSLREEKFNGHLRCLVSKKTNISQINLSKLKSTIYKVDLENPNSFQSAFRGGHIVVHI